MSNRPRPYHHGDLRRAVMDAALAEIVAVGPSAVSMREIARRAGVSHAAPAHHFGDRAGVFTAIATEGYALLHEATSEAALAPEALVPAGFAYIGFALAHPGHFEVMFRPELLHVDDADFVHHRDAAFETFYRTVRASLSDASDAEFTGTAVAAWSVVHGFVTLWLSGSLSLEFDDDAASLAEQAAGGLVNVARATASQLDARSAAPRR